jgi:nitrile hydratase accessory protein
LSEADLLANIAQPGPLRARDGEPLFTEPWQAQIVALATAMVAQGRFTAMRWSDTLGAEIRNALASGAPDNAATYYNCVLVAVETLTIEGELATAGQLSGRKAQWAHAYENTPHGAPVVLAAGDGGNGGFGGGDCGGGGGGAC